MEAISNAELQTTSQELQEKLHISQQERPQEQFMPDSGFFQPFDPRWKSGHEAFADHYDQLVFRACNLRGDNPPRESLGSRDNKRCALCNKTEGETKFSKEAHLIPAAFGNRHLFSYEECDACNGGYGETHDNQLASMFHPQRAVGRVRGRAGTAKLRHPGGDSHIGGGQFDGPLPVVLSGSDTTLEFKVSEASKTATLSMYAPPYRPVDAIKSILRSTWLSLEAAERQKHSFIRDFILGKTSFSPTEYFEFFIPTGYSATVLECWQKKASSQLPTAQLIVRFSCVNTSLVWCAPDARDGRHFPSLLPPIEGLPADSRPTGTMTAVASSDAEYKPQRATYSIAFEQRIAGNQNQPPPVIRPPKKERRKADVRLELTKPDGNTLTISSVPMIEQRQDQKIGRYLFEGGALAGSVLVHGDMASGQAQLHAEYKLHTAPAQDARRTLDFILALKRSGGILKVYSIKTGALIMRMEPSPTDKSAEEPPVAKLLDWLSVINREFGTDIRIPQGADALAPEDAELLAVAIQYGAVKTPPKEPLQVFIPPDDLNGFLESLNTYQDLEYFSEPTYRVFGHAFQPGMVRTILINPKANSTTDTKAPEDAVPQQNETVRLHLHCESAVHIFERWVKGEQRQPFDWERSNRGSQASPGPLTE
ncbi:HNH endonuclease [Corallococcus macrosporus]|nr:HNH endonuclease [Corallococcus macrosporus]